MAERRTLELFRPLLAKASFDSSGTFCSAGENVPRCFQTWMKLHQYR